MSTDVVERESQAGTTGRRIAIAAVILAALVAIAGGTLFLTAEALAISRSTLLIDQVEGIAASEGPAVLQKLSRLRFKYAGLVGTEEISVPVAEELALAESEVAEALFTDVADDSLLLAIGARHEDPEQAREIARVTAEYVVEYAEDEQRAAGILSPQRFEFEIVTPATEADPTERPLRRIAAVAGGLALLVIAFFLVVYFTRRE